MYCVLKGKEGAVKAQPPHFDLISDTWRIGEVICTGMTVEKVIEVQPYFLQVGLSTNFVA